MSNEQANLDAARRYLAAIEHGTTGPALAEFFTPDVVHEEMPNRLAPNGARQGLDGILEAATRGQQVVSAQRYEVRSETASDERVVMEVIWTGTLAEPIGTLPAGGTMRAQFAVFLDFRDGKIAAQRNYDCFEPW
jgi:ketosteroid isomerase-like protein